MTDDTLWTPTEDADRESALTDFANLCHLPPVKAIRQRRRDHRTARFTIELQGGQAIDVGTIDTLMSRTKLENVLLVACGAYVDPMKPHEFRMMVASTLRCACDVEETPDDHLKDRVLDWLEEYTRNASKDRAGAVRDRKPFIEDGLLHINAENFSKWLKREYAEAISPHDIRDALRDLGWRDRRISYDSEPRKDGSRNRTCARYYRGVLPDTSEPGG